MPFCNFLRESISHAGGNLIFLNIPFVERVTIHDISLLEFARRFWSFNPSGSPFLQGRAARARESLSRRAPAKPIPASGICFQKESTRKERWAFYGIQTVCKVMREKLCQKTLFNAQNHVDGKIFKP